MKSKGKNKKAPHISNLRYRFVRKDIKKNIVMGVKAGKAYESEVKIAKEILEGGIELKGEYFIRRQSIKDIQRIERSIKKGIE
jgi:hypothetical protein